MHNPFTNSHGTRSTFNKTLLVTYRLQNPLFPASRLCALAFSPAPVSGSRNPTGFGLAQQGLLSTILRHGGACSGQSRQHACGCGNHIVPCFVDRCPSTASQLLWQKKEDERCTIGCRVAPGSHCQRLLAPRPHELCQAKQNIDFGNLLPRTEQAKLVWNALSCFCAALRSERRVCVVRRLLSPVNAPPPVEAASELGRRAESRHSNEETPYFSAKVRCVQGSSRKGCGDRV